MRSLEFRHRPGTDTPLKKGIHGERDVALSEAVTDVIDHYVTHNRIERRDDNGRRPLFTTTQGRPASNTVQNWCYEATLPCLRMECPHDKQRDSCEWTTYTAASNCPSSRSPTDIKSGAVTRMLNKTDRDRVKHRANTKQWENYDLASEQEKMEQRDRETVEDIEIDDPEDTEDES